MEKDDIEMFYNATKRFFPSPDFTEAVADDHLRMIREILKKKKEEQKKLGK